MAKRRRVGEWRWTAVVVAAAWMLGPGSANAAPLYLGLPNGRTLGYVVADGAVARASGADLPDVGANAFPTLADLDGDGDADALVGEGGGHVRAFRNEGTDASPRWLRQVSWEPPLDFGADAAPAAGDLDGDGDADLLIGTRSEGVRGLENVGGRQAPIWSARVDWGMDDVEGTARPALGRIDDDGALDLVIGFRSGAVRAYRGSAGAVFTEREDWRMPGVGDRVAPALGDLDGDGRAELVLSDGLAQSTVFRRAGAVWTATDMRVPDPGSGPAGPALLRDPSVAGGPLPPVPAPAPSNAHPPATPQPTAIPPPGPGAPGAPIAALDASPSAGVAPLAVRLDARGSYDPDGDALSFAWDFGDGTSGGGGDDPGAAIGQARDDYGAARATRDAGHYEDAVRLYLGLVERLIPLTRVTIDGPVKQKGTRRIDRVARWYLQKIAHDLGGIYLHRDLGLDSCEQAALALQFFRESVRQAELGGFPALPASNGTLTNITRATKELQAHDCPVPDPDAMFPEDVVVAGPVAVHEYTTPGTYVARVAVGDGRSTASAVATIVVRAGTADPGPTPTPGAVPPPGPLPPPGAEEPYEGFGADTRGGEGEREIHIRAATDAAVRAAFADASDGHAQIVFDVAGPIAITKPLPRLTGGAITIEGNGATLIGTYGSSTAATIDVRGHDVIVRNLRLRNGGDNLRVQGTDAHDVVISHVSSTGAADDGISIGYGARDVTVQYSFLAGNTRSIFVKYKTTTNVSIHHTWIMKQWIRGPLLSGETMADLRNLVVEDWTGWGARFEHGAYGNVVNSLFLLGSYARSIGGKTNSALRLNQAGAVFTAGNGYEGADAGDEGTAATPLDAPVVTTHGMDEMIDIVQRRAGCLPRDVVDQAYLATEVGWRTRKTEPYRP